MALQHTAVFVASRFEEFAELRRHLCEEIDGLRVGDLMPIDMNDGRAGPNPPLEECLMNVQRSEFMILLVGETYGGLARGHDRSFTHLEYDTAVSSGDVRILPFFIGSAYGESKPELSDEPVFAAWQQQLLDEHTVGFYDRSRTDAEVAADITQWLLKAVWQTRGAAAAQESVHPDEDAEEFEDLQAPQGVAVDEDEVDRLEPGDNETDLQLDEGLSDPSTAALKPNAVAAHEHRAEAQQALELGLFGDAIQHLERAVDIRPLDLMSHYWLAKLYLAADRKSKFDLAFRHAQKAARIASGGGSEVRAAAGYIIAAQAAGALGRNEQGLHVAKLAAGIAPYYSRAHVELARRHLALEDHDSALASVRDAYKRYQRSLIEVLSDPDFKPIRPQLDEFIRKQKQRMRRQINELLTYEHEELGAPESEETVTKARNALESATLGRMPRIARAAINRVATATRARAQVYADQSAEFEALTPPPDNRRAQVLSFNGFRSEDSAFEVVRWRVSVGEYVAEGDLLFDYSWLGSQRVSAFTYRRSRPAWIKEIYAGAGSLVSLDQPKMFAVADEAPPPMPDPSPAQALRGQLEEEGDNVRLWTRRLETAQAQRRPSWWLPLAIGITLSSAVTASIVPYMTLLAIVGALVSIKLLASRYAGPGLSIKEIRNRLNQAKESCNATNEELQAAAVRNKRQRDSLAGIMHRLETRTLVRFRPPLSPFPGLRRAREGSCVVLPAGREQEIGSRYGLTITVLPSSQLLPLPASPRGGLFRVVERDGNQLTVSRDRAYLQ